MVANPDPFSQKVTEGTEVGRTDSPRRHKDSNPWRAQLQLGLGSKQVNRESTLIDANPDSASQEVTERTEPGRMDSPRSHEEPFRSFVSSVTSCKTIPEPG